MEQATSLKMNKIAKWSNVKLLNDAKFWVWYEKWKEKKREKEKNEKEKKNDDEKKKWKEKKKELKNEKMKKKNVLNRIRINK